MTLDDAQPDDIDELPLIRNSAARLLSGREHSQFELQRKLTQKGFQSALIAQVIAEFQEANLQSDRRYAESLIRSAYNKGKGPTFITQTLHQHDIELSDIHSLIYKDEWDWYELARKVREKRFGDALPTDFHQTQKQKRFLQYRGFSSSHINEAFHS
jgi:regulatory protein